MTRKRIALLITGAVILAGAIAVGVVAATGATASDPAAVGLDRVKAELSAVGLEVASGEISGKELSLQIRVNPLAEGSKPTIDDFRKGFAPYRTAAAEGVEWLEIQVENPATGETTYAGGSAVRPLDIRDHVPPGQAQNEIGEASFATFCRTEENGPAEDAVREWVAGLVLGGVTPLLPEVEPSVLIHGPIGSGKSFLAACAYRLLQEAEIPVLWANVQTYLDTTKRAFRDASVIPHVHRLEALMVASHVLILDDLGKFTPGASPGWRRGCIRS